MRIRPAPLDPEAHPVDPWRLIEARFDPERVPVGETLFALANGYLGMRGSFEEGAPAHEPGTFVNGFYETWPINYPEEAYGLPELGQSIVTLPDSTILTLHLDGEPLRLTSGRVYSYRRELDMRAGVVTREFDWESPGGTRLRVRTERLVSFVHRHLAAYRMEVAVLEGRQPLTLVSGLLDPHAPARPRRTSETSDPRQPRQMEDALALEAAEEHDQRLLLSFRTRQTGMRVVCGIDHRFDPDLPLITRTSERADRSIEYTIRNRAGPVLRIEKFASYQTSSESTATNLRLQVAAGLDHALAIGFDTLAEVQREYLDEFWDRADVRIEGDPAVQQAVRWNLFQLAQATLRTDGSGVPAKGLTGRGYDGHYFWDVEIYVQPFLTYTHPSISRRLLTFRYGMLDAARVHAEVIGEGGALFPWRTIDGREASGHYPTSTAQYHINAAIVHALKHYVDQTGDGEALKEFGAEILVETARLWMTLGFYSARDGRFHLHGVTGPDEYSVIVDDNVYTNLMASENLTYAASIIDSLRRESPGAYVDLVDRVELRPDESDGWLRAALSMYVPFDEVLGIHPQDHDFLNQEPWDFEKTPPESYPLLLHYHPLVLRRHQIVKQADVVLAMFLLRDRFTEEQRRANFLYYEPITTADSSLSHAIECIIAADIGDDVLAIDHFEYGLLMDLANWAGNAQDGVHIASTGGVWLALVYGFAGLRDAEGQLNFVPHLPATWTQLAFVLTFRGQVFEVELTHVAITFRLRNGDPLEVEVRGRPVHLRAGRVTRVPLAD